MAIRFVGRRPAPAAPYLEPVIGRVFAFEDARAAYDHLASGAHLGKVVIAFD